MDFRDCRDIRDKGTHGQGLRAPALYGGSAWAMIVEEHGTGRAQDG